MKHGLKVEVYVQINAVPFCLVNQPLKVCIRASLVEGVGPRPFPGGWGFISQSMHFERVWVWGCGGVWVGLAPSSLTYSEFLHRWVSTTSAVECILLCPTSGRSKVSGSSSRKGKLSYGSVKLTHFLLCPSCIRFQWAERMIFCLDVWDFI